MIGQNYIRGMWLVEFCGYPHAESGINTDKGPEWMCWKSLCSSRSLTLWLGETREQIFPDYWGGLFCGQVYWHSHKVGDNESQKKPPTDINNCVTIRAKEVEVNLTVGWSRMARWLVLFCEARSEIGNVLIREVKFTFFIPVKWCL